MSNTTNSVKTIIVDGHPVFRKGLITLLEQMGNFDILLETGDVREAIHTATSNVINLAIIELSHTDSLAGIDLIKELRSISPHTQILVLTFLDEKIFAERSIRAGAKGYIMKTASIADIRLAIESVKNNEIHLSKNISKYLVSGIVGNRSKTSSIPEECLTDRELQILQLIGEGMGTSSIAGKLHISTKTVESHRANIKTKFSLADSGSLKEFAIKWWHSIDRHSKV